MSAIRLPRSQTAIALLLAALALLPSTGCGYCLFSFTCGPGNCCIEYRCRENCLEPLQKSSDTEAAASENDCPLNDFADFLANLLPPQQ